MRRWVVPLALMVTCVAIGVFVRVTPRCGQAEAQVNDGAAATLEQQAEELRSFARRAFREHAAEWLQEYADQYADGVAGGVKLGSENALTADEMSVLRAAVTRDVGGLVEAGALGMCVEATIREAPFRFAHTIAIARLTTADRDRVAAQIQELGEFLEHHIAEMEERVAQAAEREGRRAPVPGTVASDMRNEYELEAGRARDNPLVFAYKLPLTDERLAFVKTEVERRSLRSLGWRLEHLAPNWDPGAELRRSAEWAYSMLRSGVVSFTPGPEYPPEVQELRARCWDAQVTWLQARDELPRTQTTALLMEQWLLVREEMCTGDSE